MPTNGVTVTFDGCNVVRLCLTDTCTARDNLLSSDSSLRLLSYVRSGGIYNQVKVIKYGY